MIKHNYRDDFAAGVVAAGGTLGIMIPPSIPLVVYGIMTENSIAKLFIAGIVPGLITSFLLCIFIFLRARLQPELITAQSCTDDVPLRPDPLAHFHQSILTELKVFIPPFILILIIMGSLYTGLATPTEASGFGAMGAIALVIVLGRWTFGSFFESLYATAKTSTMIFFLIFGGMALSYVVSYMGIPHDIAKLIVELGVNRWVFILCVYILWFILGCLMDPMSMIVLTIPLLYPTFTALKFDPIWVGIVTTLSVEIGMVTPPVGFNLFVLASTTNVPMSRIIRGTVPFLIVLVLALVLFTVFPEIVLFLPSRAM
jgi:C4-dicarboxylate transporter DctM subunit